MDNYDEFRDKVFRGQRRELFKKNLRKNKNLLNSLSFFILLAVMLLVFKLNQGLREDFLRGVGVAQATVLDWTSQDMARDFTRGVAEVKKLSNQLFYEGWEEIGEIVTENGDTVAIRKSPQAVKDAEKRNIQLDVKKVWGFKALNKRDSSLVQYVEKYYMLAIEEMLRTGVPASITLAQGLCESGAGTSNLCKQTNNHFGVKCRRVGKNCKDWVPREGAIDCKQWDDDHPCDRFCVYPSSKESYRAHSTVLLNPRYKRIFWYPVSDSLYELDKSWYGVSQVPYYAACAAMLKRGGYATDKNYHYTIAGLIDKLDLWQFDFATIALVNKP